MTGRASNGESTIHKGADGGRHGYVSLGFKANGRPDRRHVSSKNRGVVVAEVRKLELQLEPPCSGGTSTCSPAP